MKSKVKVENFHIFLTASGEGGVNPSGQPDRFFPVFFYDSPKKVGLICPIFVRGDPYEPHKPPEKVTFSDR